MATPHISGLIAYLLARDGNVSPAALQAKIKRLAQKNALGDIRKCHPVFTLFVQKLRLFHSFGHR